ncbi:MAG: HTTM domain-containing protein [Myxococcales bacterium]|nr:HTTM domain-containing protein [Myxococcales bacterium]
MRGLGPGLWERLHRPGSALQLAFLRAALGGYLLVLYRAPMLGYLHELTLPRFYGMTWSVLPGGFERFLYVSAMPALHVVGIVATAAMTVGLATRASTIAATVCWVLQFDVYYRMTKSHVDWPYWNVILLVLCCAHAGDRLSLDALIRRRRGVVITRNPQVYRWPVELCAAWIALVYVAAALAKLLPLRAGIEWLGGAMLHHVVTTFHYDSPVYWMTGAPLFDYSLRWPFCALSVAAVLVELAAALVLFQQRANLAIMLAIMTMHLGVYLTTGVIAFLYSGAVCLLFFSSPEWFRDCPRAEAGA